MTRQFGEYNRTRLFREYNMTRLFGEYKSLAIYEQAVNADISTFVAAKLQRRESLKEPSRELVGYIGEEVWAKTKGMLAT